MIPKFRVFEKWDFNDPRPGLMWYVTILRIEDNEFVGVTKGGSEVWKKLTKKHILMQSTGLKDKNGVEIFEGDIVRLVEEGGDFAVSKVYFSEGAFGMEIENVFISFATMKMMAEVDYTLEVIGNIYENPELLQ